MHKMYPLLGALMISAFFVAQNLMPTEHLAQRGPEFSLATAMPAAFGEWSTDERMEAAVVSAEQKAILNKLYSQTLSRTYINRSTGEQIMVSVAYGNDQRDSLQLHFPEVCYPAQGFEVRFNQPGSVKLDERILPVRRLVTQLGGERVEPITYWVLIGSTPTMSGASKKITEMKYGLRGLIPDGLLFRISSIDNDKDAAFRTQELFINELNRALPPDLRTRFLGDAESTANIASYAGNLKRPDLAKH